MLSSVSSAYKGTAEIIQRYWSCYGGWKALVVSPFFHISIFVTVILSRYWMHEAWWDVSLSVLPNIIGFALGGYAIWLGFGDEKFRNLISERDGNSQVSPYLGVSATFAHFIVVQILALAVALVAKATSYNLSCDHWIGRLLHWSGAPLDIFEKLAPWGYCSGFLLLSYALMTAVAATLAVFRVASWFDLHRNNGSN